MIPQKPVDKQRKWRRFRMIASAVVMLHKPRLFGFGKPSLVELGPIVDISKGGLAVQYIDTEERQIDCLKLSISLENEGIVLEGIPFQVVADFEVGEMPGSKKIRKRCMEFQELSSFQKLKLETFIKKYAEEIFKDNIKHRQT